jgi:LacI family transcriptional regulator
MAIGCLAALRSRGLRVPDDVSLVGFDDIPIVRFLTPALTTVQVPIAEIVGRALQRLVEVLQGGREIVRRNDVVTPSLAVRASTSAAPQAVARSENSGRKEP